MWCGRRESNPHRPFEPCGFSYRPRLSPPGWYEALVSGLRSGLSLHLLPDDSELRCCPSSLYTFLAKFSPGLARDCHINNEVSPNLSSSASPVSQRALKFFSSPLRLPFRHARARLSDFVSMIGQIRLLSPVRLPISPPGRISSATE
jgi:hypothetical protein